MQWEDGRRFGFGLYLHWPYCISKCPYCDFNSHVAAEIDNPAWALAYRAEIDRLAQETDGRVLSTIYFGGGTPSLMAPELVEEVIAAARARWPLANDCEITLEANPSSVEAAKFRDYRAAGVNRVSLGVQALNDADLRRLGRAHDVGEAKRALEIARANFDRVSFDLIYARQGQGRAAWRDELREALSFTPDHLSLYQLTIEDGTVFGRRHAAGRLPGLPNEALSASMYEDTAEFCSKAGLPAYEISNHARPGNESRHNLIYWRGGDYLGIGPGAHGRLTLAGRRFATVSYPAPQSWLAAVRTKGSGESERVMLRPEEWGEELVMMGLRTGEGIDPGRFAAISGKPLAEEKVSELAELGLLTRVEGRLAATRHGRLLLNRVVAQLLA